MVIFLVALVVLGPKKLPELGRTLGKVVREMKKALHEFKDQVDPHIVDPFVNNVNSFKEPFQNVINPINDLMPVKSSETPKEIFKTTELPKPPEPIISKEIPKESQVSPQNEKNEPLSK
ncbi:MAG: twin-arginine translocase TatA/TatE family subunit [Nitrospirae bacterium]|nr:twin-arginine translocase TatA/TatE family subunit [Nitrospirota bacterium]